MSIRDRFADPQTVLIEEPHRHLVRPRAWASYLGLTLVLLAWVQGLHPVDRLLYSDRLLELTSHRI